MKLGLKRGFSDEALVEGGENVQRRAQADLNREVRLRVAMQSGKPELLRSDLKPAHLGLLEHVETGEVFAVSQGEQDGEFHTFDAYFIGRDGSPVFLQRPASGPTSRAELDAQRAEQEARRNAPRPRPSWMQQ